MPLTHKYKNFQDLPEKAKHVPLTNMLDKLEELQDQEKTGTLTQEEETRMNLLENYIELKLAHEINLQKFIAPEELISDNAANDNICFKLDDVTFVEDFVSKYYFEACQKSTFFITKLSLN